MVGKKKGKGRRLAVQLDLPKQVSAALAQGNKRWVLVLSIKEFGLSEVSGRLIGKETNASKRTKMLNSRGAPQKKERKRDEKTRDPKVAKPTDPKVAKAAKAAKSSSTSPNNNPNPGSELPRRKTEHKRVKPDPAPSTDVPTLGTQISAKQQQRVSGKK